MVDANSNVSDGIILGCRDSLDIFLAGAFSIVNPGTAYKWSWHIDCISEHLEAAYRGEIKRLIFNIPPRELKSFLISTCFPAWVLGREAHEKFIVASHSLRPLAAKLSSDTSRLMNSDWYKKIFPNTILEKDTEFEIRTTQNGGRLAAAQTGVVGSGGNYLILDDPNKPDEALSDTIRKGTNDWVDNTFLSRMDDRTTGRVILVQQRVHENDVTGHLLDKGGYTLVKLPAEAYHPININIGRKTYKMEKGDFLHEARLPRQVLDEALIDLGEYSYAGQYLQEPTPPGGGLFKIAKIKYYDQENFDFTHANGFILCDPAGIGNIGKSNNKSKKSDWTAFMVVALADDQNYYLVDIVRDKLNPTERVNRLVDLHREWSAHFMKPLKVGYESYALQSDLHYIEQRQKDESYNFPLIPLGGKLAKENRIARLIPDLENQRWYFPHKISYQDSSHRTFDLVAEMIRGEMLTFPVSKHDDCIDALSRIYDEEMYAKFPAPRKQKDLVGSDILSGLEKNDSHWVNL